ncbi:hypothetical protein MMC14_010800 [Varicellaria rhodocarpa]|nr:hypothetical protein [Varicellaria rhodocarpa]
MPELKIWLLLVGIDEYPNKDYQLHGAVNDILDIELSLKERYKEINVTKLMAPISSDSGPAPPPRLESLPTWDNFTTALKSITQKATKGDIVWVYYSGHGTLKSTTDLGLTYRENYGTDAALVLLEPDGQWGVRYLRGLELTLLLDDMVNKGLKATVVLDSCHSGSVSRHENHMVRGMPWSTDIDSEFPLQSTSYGSLAVEEDILRNAKIISPWLLCPQGYALLAACGPHERANEIRVGEQRCNGALSYCMLEALNFCAQNQIQDVTYELIYRRICAKMSKVADQHPILMGAKGTTLLGAEAARLNAHSTFEVVKVSSDQEIWLNAGLIHGAHIGDKYIVRPHTEATDLVARIIITDVQAVYSVAKQIPIIASEGGSPRIKVGHCAILTALAQPHAHVKLFPGADRAWEERLVKSVWLHRLPPDEPASIDVSCFSIKTNGQIYTILDSQSSPIPNLPPIASSNLQVSDQLLIILEHLCKYAFVRDLNNHRNDVLLDSEFSITANPENTHLYVLGSDESVVVSHDSKVEITFQNLTREVLYFTVVNLTPLRRIKHLYPQHKEYETVMPRNLCEVLPREMHDISPPGKIHLAPRMKIPERLEIQQSGCVTAEDVLKFFVSTCPIRGIKSMELPDLWYIMESGAAAIGSGHEAFGVLAQKSLLDQSDKREHTRGVTTRARWACRSITIRTVLQKD